jgi:hypothetical protein
VHKQLVATIGAIVLTGAILNILGSGLLGEAPRKAAQFITKGYGV